MATVLLVPGFGGSKLVAPPTFLSGSAEVWLNPFNLATGSIYHLRLSDNSLRPYYPFARSLVPAGPIDYYYPPLEQYLTARGWQVVWAQSDWRLDLDRSALVLANQMATLGWPDPIRVVAHSRGGLLAQRACQLLAAESASSLVRQVVCVCCPFAGSYCVVPFLGGWVLSNPENKGLWAAVGALDSVPLLGSIFRDICASLPGLYELLPDPVAADAHGGDRTAAYYDPATWSTAGVPVNAVHLSDALARWAGRPAFPAGVRVDLIVGEGHATAGAGGRVPGVFGPGPVRDGTGDGTVPDWSASAVAARSVTRLTVAHNESLRDPAALAVIDTLLRS